MDKYIKNFNIKVNEIKKKNSRCDSEGKKKIIAMLNEQSATTKKSIKYTTSVEHKQRTVSSYNNQTYRQHNISMNSPSKYFSVNKLLKEAILANPKQTISIRSYLDENRQTTKKENSTFINKRIILKTEQCQEFENNDTFLSFGYQDNESQKKNYERV